MKLWTNSMLAAVAATALLAFLTGGVSSAQTFTYQFLDPTTTYSGALPPGPGAYTFTSTGDSATETYTTQSLDTVDQLEFNNPLQTIILQPGVPEVDFDAYVNNIDVGTFSFTKADTQGEDVDNVFSFDPIEAGMPGDSYTISLVDTTPLPGKPNPSTQYKIQFGPGSLTLTGMSGDPKNPTNPNDPNNPADPNDPSTPEPSSVLLTLMGIAGITLLTFAGRKSASARQLHS